MGTACLPISFNLLPITHPRENPMTDRKEKQPIQPVPDEVTEAGRESFPASDPPAHSSVGPSDAPVEETEEQEDEDNPFRSEEADA